MAKQTINIGASYDDPTAEPIRDGFDKVNDNFTELYDGNITISGNKTFSGANTHSGINLFTSTLSGRRLRIGTGIGTLPALDDTLSYTYSVLTLLTDTSDPQNLINIAAGSDGDLIYLIEDSTTLGEITIKTTGNIVTKSGSDIAMAADTFYCFIYLDSKWRQMF